MKRIFLPVFCVLILTLAGCSNSPAPAVSPLDADTVETTLTNSAAFSEALEPLDGDMAYALYRLADYDIPREGLTDVRVMRSAGATCEEWAFLTFETAAQAESALDALGVYLEDQEESNQNYRPQEIPKLEQAVLNRRENTLLMIVAEDAQGAWAALEG